MDIVIICVWVSIGFTVSASLISLAYCVVTVGHEIAAALRSLADSLREGRHVERRDDSAIAGSTIPRPTWSRPVAPLAVAAAAPDAIAPRLVNPPKLAGGFGTRVPNSNDR